MSGVATAVVGSAVVGAYASKKSSDAQAKAAKKGGDAQVAAAEISAEAQKEANQANIDFQKEIFEQQREDQAPWRKIGEQSLEQLQRGIKSGKFRPGEFRFDFDFEADPGYQFRKQEGMNALDRSAASRGRLQSGAQSRAATRYASNLASDEYNRAYGRQFNTQQAEYQSQAANKGQRFNQLASLANVGQVANQQTAAARGQMAESVGQSTRATGQAIAQGARQTGNALAASAQQQGAARASGYQGMAGAAQQGVQNYLLYNMVGG